jgi:CBS domain-containing protein
MHAATTQPRIHQVTVGEVMTREVVTISPESTLRDLLTLLAERGVGGVPVVEGDEVVGVVSARDLIDYESETSAGTGEPDAWEAWDEEEDAVPGAYFTEDAPVDLGSAFREERRGADDPLAGQAVSEVMTRGLVTVPAHALLRDAAERMVAAGVHRLLVLDGARLVGIVTTTDLVRALARHG